MKRSYYGVLAMSVVLLLNIALTQQVVNSFFYEHYWRTIIFAGLNVLVLPIAVWVYRRDRRND